MLQSKQKYKNTKILKFGLALRTMEGVIYVHIQQISPTTLVEELKMAKSNVALFCKKLLQEQLIISKQDKLDKRVIYYCLTKKGQKVITNNLKTISDKIVLSSSQSNLKNISKSTKMLYESISKLGV